MSGRRWVMAWIAVPLGVASPLAAPVAGHAAPACRVAPGPVGEALTEPGWARLRYGPERLSGIADGTGITVAVVDSGVDARHPQLAGAVGPGADVLASGDGTVDCAGHGTAVASIVAARPASGSGFAGVAPGARILPVRVSDRLDSPTADTDAPTATPAQLASAIRFAVDRGAQVLNLSLVTYRDEPPVRAAVAYAVARDVLVVASVGRREPDRTPYPAAYPGVLGVGAVGADGLRTDDSAVGPHVDVVAPGIAVLAAGRERGLLRFTGTSFAAPFVSGAAALVRSYDRSLSAAQVAERLRATADPAPGPGEGYGAGVVNPYRAVTGSTTGGGSTGRAVAPDPDARAADAPIARTHERAVRAAAAGATLAGLVIFGAAVLRRGRRTGYSNRRTLRSSMSR